MPYLLITKDDNPLLIEDAIADIRQTQQNEVAVYRLNDFAGYEKAVLEVRSPSLFDAIKPIAVFVANEKLAEKILKAKSQYSLAFKTIKIFPIGLHQFPTWSDKYFKKSGYTLTSKAKSLLSDFCEGNVLAAHQCLQKLKLLYHPPYEVTENDIMEFAVSSTRYNIFDLINILSPGISLSKIEKILKSLQEEGVEPAIVLWGIARHCRQKHCVQVLPILVKADNIIKGGESGDVWQLFVRACRYFVEPKQGRTA